MLIAGGGVAALEAVLALRELRGVPLESVAADLGFVLHETRVERVDPDRSSVLTALADLIIATHEVAPLELFGPRASEPGAQGRRAPQPDAPPGYVRKRELWTLERALDAA